MEQSSPSPAECRRIALLAPRIPRDWWVVCPDDPTAEVAACAAAVLDGPARVLAVTPGGAVAASRRLAAAGVRTRVHVVSGSAQGVGASWRGPVGLLCLSAHPRALRALLAAWAGHVSPRGYVAFYGGGPRDRSGAGAWTPATLGLRGELWAAHPADGARPLLLVRRPHG